MPHRHPDIQLFARLQLRRIILPEQEAAALRDAGVTVPDDAVEERGFTHPRLTTLSWAPRFFSRWRLATVCRWRRFLVFFLCMAAHRMPPNTKHAEMANGATHATTILE